MPDLRQLGNTERQIKHLSDRTDVLHRASQIVAPYYNSVTINNSGDGTGAVGTTQSPLRISIPDPGFTYRIQCGGTASVTLGPNGVVVNSGWAVGSKDGTALPGQESAWQNSTTANASGYAISFPTINTGPFTGPVNLFAVLIKTAGPTTSVVQGDTNRPRANAIWAELRPA